MRNIKLVLQYDGTDFSGWQSQKQGERTVQSVLEGCIARVTGEAVRLKGAGRTDAGVHALGQVAAFSTGSALPAETLGRALNATLPEDVRVASAEEAEGPFNPRTDSKGKLYAYIIADMPYTPPFVGRYAWGVKRRLDEKAMAEAASALAGRHDFRAFMGAGSGVSDTVREIRSIVIEAHRELPFLGLKIPGRYLRISIEGDGFLRHMVRNIVGTLVEAGKGRIEPPHVSEIVSSRDRGLAGPTAPARGLFLERVYY